jgi:hypothetical protein
LTPDELDGYYLHCESSFGNITECRCFPCDIIGHVLSDTTLTRKPFDSGPICYRAPRTTGQVPASVPYCIPLGHRQPCASASCGCGR